MSIGQQVRFTRPAPNGEWAKGDLGIIEAVLARRPLATSDIFLIRLSEEGQAVWATHEDIQFSGGEQLTLF
jgi:hypothetical protein